MLKKIFIAVVVLCVLGAGVVFYLKTQATPEAVEQTPLIAKKITDGKVISPVSAYNGDAIWFGLPEGRLMRYNVNDSSVTEYPTPQVIGNSFVKLYWPNQGNDFIAVGVSDGLLTYSFYNNTDKKYYVLPKNVIALDWLSDNRQVVMVWRAGDGKIQLVTSNADASGYKILNTLPWSDLVPKASPMNKTALMYRSSSNGMVNKIYLFDLETGKYQDIVSAGNNTGALWSPMGDMFVYSQMDSDGTQLYLYDMLTKQSKPLNMQALIDQVGFSSDGSKIYSIAPSDDLTAQVIREFDILTEQVTVRFEMSAGANARHPVAIGQKIFVVGQEDGSLYSIE